MVKTEKEIMSQVEALKRTFDLIEANQNPVKAFFRDVKKAVFIGCGSGYALCKSAALSMSMHTDIKACAVAAGDAMINFDYYRNIFKDAVIIAPSRSGSTSEVVNLVKTAKEQCGSKCLCISARAKSVLSELCELSLEIPWAFDESVCQTRTVTNLYAVNLMLTAILTGNPAFLREIKTAIHALEIFMSRYKALCLDIGNIKTWDKVVVLADADMEGIADEAALAFKEICQLPSNYYHVLDSRHGPMVLYDDKTLVIAVLSPKDHRYQNDFIKDVKARGCMVLAVSCDLQNVWGADYHVSLPAFEHFGTGGIPFITIPQMISLYKAYAIGINPDLPKGLDPWIKL